MRGSLAVSSPPPPPPSPRPMLSHLTALIDRPLGRRQRLHRSQKLDHVMSSSCVTLEESKQPHADKLHVHSSAFWIGSRRWKTNRMQIIQAFGKRQCSLCNCLRIKLAAPKLPATCGSIIFPMRNKCFFNILIDRELQWAGSRRAVSEKLDKLTRSFWQWNLIHFSSMKFLWHRKLHLNQNLIHRVSTVTCFTYAKCCI